ncbi:MAG: nuclear transport factor 2 family protein [Puniceicoccales bacterium]
MDAALVKACESFSEGRLDSALGFLSPNVLWRVMGDRDCEGHEAVQNFCQEMTANGCPDLQNMQTTIGERTVVIEGAENKPGGILYCDSFTIDGGAITEIRSYCAVPSN